MAVSRTPREASSSASNTRIRRIGETTKATLGTPFFKTLLPRRYQNPARGFQMSLVLTRPQHHAPWAKPIAEISEAKLGNQADFPIQASVSLCKMRARDVRKRGLPPGPLAGINPSVPPGTRRL